MSDAAVSPLHLSFLLEELQSVSSRRITVHSGSSVAAHLPDSKRQTEMHPDDMHPDDRAAYVARNGYPQDFRCDEGEEVEEEEEEEDFEFDNPLNLNMNKIMQGLYIGDFAASQQYATLRELGITNVISAMRQKYSAPPDISLHRVLVEDSDKTNIIAHFEVCNEFIRNALLRGEGVLVHCQAGVSRSSTLCAAFLMHEFGLTVEEAIARIVGVRSQVQPTEFFLHQLEMYERMNCEVDPARYAEYRRFLMNFNHVDIMDGDGSVNQLFLAYYPSPAPTPRDRSMSDPFRSLRMTSIEGDTSNLSRRSSNASMKSGFSSRRSSAASSRRPSRSEVLSRTSMTPTTAEGNESPSSTQNRSKRGRLSSGIGMTPMTMTPSQPSRNPSGTNVPTISSLASDDKTSSSPASANAASIAALNGSASLRDDIRKMLHKHAETANGKTKDDSAAEKKQQEEESLKLEMQRVIDGKEKLLKVGMGRFVVQGRRLRCKMCRRELAARQHIVDHEPGEGQAAFAPRRRDMVQHRIDLERKKAQAMIKQLGSNGRHAKSAPTARIDPPVSEEESCSSAVNPISPAHGSDEHDATIKTWVAEQISSPPKAIDANQKEATPIFQRRGGTDIKLSLTVDGLPSRLVLTNDCAIEDDSPVVPDLPSPPLLNSSTCSSYFTEPLSWMSDQLSDGQIGGKILCPNKRCGAKLGTFDWAGLQCSCGAWIVPAFQLSASKVDEV